jgi:hypothetical protein
MRPKQEYYKVIITSNKHSNFMESFSANIAKTSQKTHIIFKNENDGTISTFEDNGNEIVYTSPTNVVLLSYHEAQELRALLKLSDRNEDQFEFIKEQQK